MKYIASCSWGKDSTAMLLLLLEKKEPLDEVVFYDTGMEYQAIYNLRDKILPVLKTAGVKYTELNPEKCFTYYMLHKPVNGRKNGFHYGYGWCGGTCRWGTTMKNETISKYLDSMGEPYIEYVGIAVDEPERIRGKTYPLVSWNMTEADCLTYCYTHGYNWNENGVDLYAILDRVSCWCCRNKNRRELQAMWKYLPAYWERLKELQAQIPEPMKKYSCKGIAYGNVYDLEKRFEEEMKNA